MGSELRASGRAASVLYLWAICVATESYNIIYSKFFKNVPTTFFVKMIFKVSVIETARICKVSESRNMYSTFSFWNSEMIVEQSIPMKLRHCC